jgi:hypothetical protein
MRDDDYVPSRYASPTFNIPAALKDLERPRKRLVAVPQLRGGVELRSVWDEWDEARRSDNPPATRLMFIMRKLHLTYPELARASRIDPKNERTGLVHTSVLRCAKNASVPYRKANCIGKMVVYINSALEIAGYEPVEIGQLFPPAEHYRGCTRSRYLTFLAAAGA